MAFARAPAESVREAQSTAGAASGAAVVGAVGLVGGGAAGYRLTPPEEGGEAQAEGGHDQERQPGHHCHNRLR